MGLGIGSCLWYLRVISHSLPGEATPNKHRAIFFIKNTCMPALLCAKLIQIFFGCTFLRQPPSFQKVIYWCKPLNWLTFLHHKKTFHRFHVNLSTWPHHCFCRYIHTDIAIKVCEQNITLKAPYRLCKLFGIFCRLQCTSLRTSVYSKIGSVDQTENESSWPSPRHGF